MKLIILSSCWLAGIVLGSVIYLPVWAITLVSVPLLFACFLRLKSRALLAGLSLLLLFTGALYYEGSLPVYGPQILAYYNENPDVTLRGAISQEVEARDRTQHLRVEVQDVYIEGTANQVNGDVLIFAPRYPEYHYGDELLITGSLDNPPVFINDTTGEVEFDYANYLALQDMYSVMVYPSIEVMSQGNGNIILSALYAFKADLSLSLGRALPEPQASLSQGILLGMRDGIPDSVKQNFSHTGTYHLLAISGLHLGIIAAIALSMGLAVFGRRYYLYVWLALLVIWFYALISGANPPVIRAAIMASVFLLAELTGRQRNALPALGLAAAVMVAIDPKVIFTASFQMSFAAMTGIILLYPGFRPCGQKLICVSLKQNNKLTRLPGVVTDSLAVSLAATLFVAPLIVYYFGIFSPLGPLVTLIALPGLVAVIISGGLIAIAGLCWPLLAGIIGWAGWLFSSYMLSVVDLAAGLHVHIGGVSLSSYMILAYYMGLLLIIWLVDRRRLIKGWFNAKLLRDNRFWQTGSISKRHLLHIFLICLVLLLIINPAGCRTDERFKIHFLDVGQGDAILFSQGNQQVLVDGGPSPQALMNELGDKMPFWDRTIDLVVLTHAHADHINGLIEVLKRYEVKQVLYPETLHTAGSYDNQAFAKWLDIIEEKSIPVTIARAGQYFYMGDVIVSVLNPPSNLISGSDSDTDNNSVVLNIQAGGLSIILTGDLMWQGELDLVLSRMLEQVHLLKVGHHGSRTSSSEEFIAVLKPGLGVICVGENSYGHPHEEAISRLSVVLESHQIYRTDTNRGVTFVTDGDKLWLKES